MAIQRISKFSVAQALIVVMINSSKNGVHQLLSWIDPVSLQKVLNISQVPKSASKRKVMEHVNTL